MLDEWLKENINEFAKEDKMSLIFQRLNTHKRTGCAISKNCDKNKKLLMTELMNHAEVLANRRRKKIK
jgi:hypothetical protein